MIAKVEIYDGENRCWIVVADHPWYRPELPSDHWRAVAPTRDFAVGHLKFPYGDWKVLGPTKYPVLRLSERCSKGRHTVLEFSGWKWELHATGKGWHHTPDTYIAEGQVSWKVLRVAASD